jgi:hypothetical protein
VKHLPSLAGGHHRTAISGPLVATSVVTALAVFAAVGSLSGPGALGRRTHEIASTPAAHASASGNFVVNGKFATSTAGWRTKSTSQRLKWKSSGHNSHGSARLKSRTGKKVVLNDAVNSMASAHKGEVVKAAAWVRAKKPGLSGKLRLKEIVNGHRVAAGSTQFRLSTTGWKHVTLSYKVTRGSSLDLNVVARSVGKHQALRVDGVRLKVTSRPAGHLPSGGRALLGMSAPSGLWSQRVSEVGAGLQARRIFLSSFTASLSLATTACNAGMSPVLSFKTGAYTWAQIAAGSADAALRALATKINALPCNSFVAIHHEPSSGASNPTGGEGGTAADYARMQAHALPLLGGAIGGKVKVGPIGNGWWFNTRGGLTDAQLKVWVSPAVLAASDFVAADTYQGQATAETVASKINRMGAWARRTTGVRGLGLGEFNMQTSQGMTDATTALGSDPLFEFGCIWNMDGTGSANAHVLTGSMLTAFKTALAGW